MLKGSCCSTQVTRALRADSLHSFKPLSHRSPALPKQDKAETVKVESEKAGAFLTRDLGGSFDSGAPWLGSSASTMPMYREPRSKDGYFLRLSASGCDE